MERNEEKLQKLLVHIAEEQKLDNYVIKIEPISSGGANYTSFLYNIIITEGDNPVQMFAKVAAVGEKFRSAAPNMYDIENFVYTKILKAYVRLQAEHLLSHEDRVMFSKFYGYNPTAYEEIIVVENLEAKGYQAFDRFKTIDWQYAKSAIRELAKMHALSYAFNEHYPEEFDKVIQELKSKFKSGSDQIQGYFEGSMFKAIEVIQDENRDKLQRFFDEAKKEGLGSFYNYNGPRPVLVHGDFRPSNLMHRVRDDGTVDIKIVDLQTMQGNSPIIDLLYFIFTGSDEEFRAQYYEKLLEHYYTQLHAAMKRLHLDPDKIYSREDFEHELKEKLPFGLTMAAITLPVITVDAENAPKVNEDTALTDFSVLNTSDLYTERMNGIVNDYVRWGILT